MTTLLHSLPSRNPGRVFSLLSMAFTLAVYLPAQTPDMTPPVPPAGGADAAQNPGDRWAGRGNFNPADMQARMMASLREQFGVTEDAEWNLIGERITAIMDLRRTQMVGGFGGAFGGRGPRLGGPASPEQDALRTALTDKLPDAEITARLARVREVRKQNEAKLDQAREALRAVLTLRQEAVAVMAGLLN